MGEKSVMITARVSEEEHAAIERRAAGLGMSVSSLIRLLAKSEVSIVFTVDRKEGDTMNY